jgi:hypothetical protein
MKKPDKGGEWYPCSQEKGFCSTMAAKIKFPGEGGYGFFAVMVMNSKELTQTLAGAMYKTSAKDRGVMMNFCPYCGTKIDWFRGEGL